jgi:hypothetical protein
MAITSSGIAGAVRAPERAAGGEALSHRKPACVRQQRFFSGPFESELIEGVGHLLGLEAPEGGRQPDRRLDRTANQTSCLNINRDDRASPITARGSQKQPRRPAVERVARFTLAP